MKKPKLGSGLRFKKLTSDLRAKNHNLTDDDANALAAYMGRKKFGKKRFAQLSAKGK